MKIKMLETKDGSNDGVTVETFKKGETYDVGTRLCDNFVRQQGVADELAEPVTESSAEPETEPPIKPEKKSRKKAPKNKARSGPPRNK